MVGWLGLQGGQLTTQGTIAKSASPAAVTNVASNVPVNGTMPVASTQPVLNVQDYLTVHRQIPSPEFYRQVSNQAPAAPDEGRDFAGQTPLASAALALGAACGAAAAPPGNDPLEWLQRAAQAARSASYSGTYAHSNGDRTSTIRVTHIAVGNDEQERIEPSTGRPTRSSRRNDEMLCYFPDSKTIRLDRRVSARFFPAIFSAPPSAVAATTYPRSAYGERAGLRLPVDPP